jgi:hypothetical protein
MKTSPILRSGFLILLLGSFSLSSHAQTAKTEAVPSVITDPKVALKDIPREVMADLRPGSRQMVDAAGKASIQAVKNVGGKTGTFKFNVRAVEKFQRPDAPDVTRLRILSTTDNARVSGVAVDVYVAAILDLSENEKAAKIGPGSKLTLTGMIINAEILGRQRAELRLYLENAKIVK